MIASSGKYLSRLLLSASCCFVLMPGANAGTTFYFSDIDNSDTTNSGTIKESIPGPDIAVGTITAWSNGDEDGPTVALGTDPFSQSDLDKWGGGVGVGGEFSPEHSLDNVFAQEFVLALFDQKVVLSDVYVGWNGTQDGWGNVDDSDMTIMAFTDGDFSQTDLDGVSPAGLEGAGWEKVNNLFNVTNGWTSIGNSTDIASTAWLIGAYNPFISGNSYGKCCDSGVKLKKLYGTFAPPETQVPLPGTALLLGLGLLMVRARTRR